MAEQRKKQQASNIKKIEPEKQDKPKNKATKKLSFKDQKELETLPAIIDTLETEQALLTKQISSTAFYQQEQNKVNETLDKLKDIESELEKTYQRWEELDALAN